MMNKLVITIVAILIVSHGATSAQEAWSLEKCIGYALDNNISIKRQEINAEYKSNLLKQSKLDRLPSLNAESAYGYSFGYTWVQQEAQNVDRDIKTFSIQAGASVPVFGGLNQNNKIKQNQTNLMEALEQTEKMKNDIILQITGQFLQILFDKELLAVAKEQYELSKQQQERTKQLVDAGSQAMGSYLEIKSQAAKEALNVTQQENNLALSLLSLAQLLDLENVVDFDVEIPHIPSVEALVLDKPSIVYHTALGIMPQIKSAEYSLESSQYGVKIAQSGYYPTLSLNYSIGASSTWLIDDPDGYNRSFNDQLKSTRNTYVGATLSIPIFNKFQTRSNVKNAKLDLMDAQYLLNIEKLSLRKEIQQAYADAMAAYNKYLSSNEAVGSYKESFRYTEQKFNVGLVNSVDYNVAKTDYTKAQSDLLQSQYEYILRSKILDFYKGIPISL